jgi:hypothetical protein
MIVEGRLWHLQYLVDYGLRPEDVAAIEAFTMFRPDEEWVMASYKAALYKRVCLDGGGMPVIFTALYPLCPGVLFSWTVGIDKYRKHVREWIPEAKRFFDEKLALPMWHRIECDVLEGFDAAERTIRHFGFEKEGVRRALGKDRRNAIMYARIKQ